MLSQIEQAFAERQASENRLRRFVADASHELRTPLTSVRGYAELFRRGAADRPADLENAMRRIEAEAARMGVLVDDLLLLARLDQGRPLEQERVDLVPLVTELVADARAIEPDRPLELNAQGSIEVLGDDARLRQAVGNLLANARAHCPPEAAVTVSVSRAGDEAIIEVADTGPGIDPENLDARVRTLLPRRPVAHPRQRRHRPGPLDRGVHRRGPRRPGRGLEHAGRGQQLPGGDSLGSHRRGESRTITR